MAKQLRRGSGFVQRSVGAGSERASGMASHWTAPVIELRMGHRDLVKSSIRTGSPTSPRTCATCTAAVRPVAS